ncbi:6120_t:CDS:2, partial [Funneliformis geosporum]
FRLEVLVNKQPFQNPVFWLMYLKTNNRAQEHDIICRLALLCLCRNCAALMAK